MAVGILFSDEDHQSQPLVGDRTDLFEFSDKPTSGLKNNSPSSPIDKVIEVPLFVTGNAVNVRSGPGIKTTILGKKYKGEIIQSVDQSGNWTKIKFGKKYAWISSTYVSKAKPLEQPTKSQLPPKRTVAAPSTREISAAKKVIINRSIAAYPGSCPCPYNYDRGGRRCGARSAWSKPGGYSPLCYESDVSDARVKSYFARVRGAVY